MMDIEKELQNFIKELGNKNNNINIYNEISLQLELGMFLREKLKKGYKVEFERNVTSFGNNKSSMYKKEIDIVVYKNKDRDTEEKYAIELKFPRNGQYPEEMYQFIKDIAFIDQLIDNGFTKAYALTIVDDGKFYKNENTTDGIYGYFRNTNKNEIKGQINKPTGNKTKSINMNGKSHKINWQPIKLWVDGVWKDKDCRYYLEKAI